MHPTSEDGTIRTDTADDRTAGTRGPGSGAAAGLAAAAAGTAVAAGAAGHARHDDDPARAAAADRDSAMSSVGTRPGTAQPGTARPGGTEPIGTRSGDTRTGGDPAGGDPVGGDPVGGDPVGGDPVGEPEAATRPVGTQSGGPAASTAPAGTGTAPERLVTKDRAQELRGRWDSVKGSFVDEPRDAVQQADALVGELLDELDRLFRQQRQELEHGLHTDGTSTEDLRLALRRYRSFFDRLIDL